MKPATLTKADLAQATFLAIAIGHRMLLTAEQLRAAMLRDAERMAR